MKISPTKSMACATSPIPMDVPAASSSPVRNRSFCRLVPQQESREQSAKSHIPPSLSPNQSGPDPDTLWYRREVGTVSAQSSERGKLLIEQLELPGTVPTRPDLIRRFPINRIDPFADNSCRERHVVGCQAFSNCDVRLGLIELASEIRADSPKCVGGMQNGCFRTIECETWPGSNRNPRPDRIGIRKPTRAGRSS
jgi:hypothetical protein